MLQFDPPTNQVERPIRVGLQPIGAVFANGAVWVANSRDPDTLDVTDTTVGGTPTGIAANEDGVWVTVTP